VLLNGVSDPVGTVRRQPFSNGSEIRLLMIGRINSWKGQDLLARAVADLPTKLAERVVVKYVGAAFQAVPAEADLRSLVGHLGLSAQVEFEGFVSNPAALYQWADIVVVPSKRPEPFGLVAVEAMAHGRPVIAAAHGGLVEIVKHGESGFLVAPGSVPELVQAICRLALDPATATRMAQAGRTIYAQRFTEQCYRDGLLALFNGALAPATRAEGA